VNKITIGAACVASASVVALAMSGPEPATEDGTTVATYKTFECQYEDMLAFELKDPAYDLPAGYTVCVHIDEAHDLPQPGEVNG